MIIRDATINDIEGIFEVLLEMIESEDLSSQKIAFFLMNQRMKRDDFETSAREELEREFSQENSRFLIAIIDEKIVGYIRGTIREDEDSFFKMIKKATLNAIAVHKDYQGKKIASKLNDALENWFKEQGCAQVQLSVLEHNPAIAIYEKWGYIPVVKEMVKKL